MLFNSYAFAIFLIVVFPIYWAIRNNLKLQNLFVLFISYFFYGCWDWRFLSLIVASSITDYFVAIWIEKSRTSFKKKVFLSLSLVVNLGALATFKYYNFFLESLETLFPIIRSAGGYSSLSIILPVGISFYTFQTLSYSIDIYRGKMKTGRDPIGFLAFVSFFPQLVAGPIERASHLLPQFERKRTFQYHEAADGMRQILWGLFKKMVIADNCAIYVNKIFDNHSEYSGSTLLVGCILFSFQIYGDFSGYSDIAIGTAKLFGIQLNSNFNFPYFSKNIAEFWRRWHISLSTWFRDYVYIPCGGSRGSKAETVRNVFVVFIVSGLWHGANWTFIVWGAIHACLFLPCVFIGKESDHGEDDGLIRRSIRNGVGQASTFLLVSLSWIFFRSETLSKAFSYLSGIFSSSLFSIPEIRPRYLFLLLIFFIAFEFSHKNRSHAAEIAEKKLVIRWGYYMVIFLLIFFFSENSKNEFIYFQF